MNKILAYPNDKGQLCDWHGNVIGTYSVVSSRAAIFFGRRSWVGDRYYYMRGVVNGVKYALRGFGVGMAAIGKRLKNG